MSATIAIDTRLHPITALRAVGRLLKNPDDTEQVFTIFRAMRGASVLWAFKRFAASAAGGRLLAQRPSLLATLCDRDALRALPEGALGRAYLAFMESENLTAEGLAAAAADTYDNDPVAPDMAYYRLRTRDAHDLTHVMTGYGRDPLGETCLLAFMYAHTRNRGAALIAALSFLKMNGAGRRAVREAWRNGRKAVWFQNQNYEALLGRPLEDVRRDLNIVQPVLYHAASR